MTTAVVLLHDEYIMMALLTEETMLFVTLWISYFLHTKLGCNHPCPLASHHVLSMISRATVSGVIIAGSISLLNIE